MRDLEVASFEMSIIVADIHVKKALRSRLPPAENYGITPGDTVRVYRETDVKIHGPYVFVLVQGKQIFLDREGTLLQHNIAQVIPNRIYKDATRS